MAARSLLSDTKILQGTVQSAPDAKGRVQLQFTLPSGRVVTSSDRLVPGEIKGRVLIAWADAIRAEDAADINEREERENLSAQQRRAQRSTAPMEQAASAASSSPSPQSSGTAVAPSAAISKATSTSIDALSASLPDDPAALIAAKLDSLINTHDSLARQRSEIEAQLIRVRSSIARWEAVARGLGLSGMTTTGKSVELTNDVPEHLVDRSPGPDVARKRGRPRKRMVAPGIVIETGSQEQPVQGSAVEPRTGVDSEQPDAGSDAAFRLED